MALADVCGFSTGSPFASLGFQPHDFQRDVVVGAQNLDNNFTLACPPFEEVNNIETFQPSERL